MKFMTTNPAAEPASILYTRCTVDLKNGTVHLEEIPCRNLEDVLGGFGRSFQILAERRITQAYCEENPLIVNTGLLTGSTAMTGLRTYFSGYSPIKGSKKGLPSAIWAAGSGNFGPRFKWTGLDELIFEGRSSQPVYALISEGEQGPVVALKPADHLVGLSSHEKIMTLHREYGTNAQFAAIGQAGEQWEKVYFGAVALSTDNQLKSGEDKMRFAGRGGMGSLMGYKNLLALVAHSSDKMKPTSAEVKAVNINVIKGGERHGCNRSAEGAAAGPGRPMMCCRPFMPYRSIISVPRGTTSLRNSFGSRLRDSWSSSPRPVTAAVSPVTTISMRSKKTAAQDGSWPSLTMNRSTCWEPTSASMIRCRPRN